MYHITSWQEFQGMTGGLLSQALEAGEIQPTDIVWAGPAGDYYIAHSANELEEDAAEYVDKGTVDEFLVGA